MNKFIITLVLGLLSVSANALTFNHIQSQLVDYGYTGSFGGHLAYSEGMYRALAGLVEGTHTQESLSELDASDILLTKDQKLDFPTEEELEEFVQYLKDANKGTTRTVGLNSLFQVSNNTLLQFNFQLNTGYNSKALKVTPSIKLGLTVATQLTNDDSFTFTVSPKLLAGGKVFMTKTRLSISSDRDFGKVSNGTTMRLEYTHKF